MTTDLLDRPAIAAPTQADPADRVLLELLHLLRDRGYGFVTPTPATHARVLARPDRQEARDLRDLLGWSLPFRPGSVDGAVEGLLDRAGMIERLADGRVRSRVRVSSLHDRLYLHSAYPTDAEDAVFFGPDSYRFADLIRAELSHCPERADAQIVDIGTGAGVGAIVAASACPRAAVRGTDVNPKALRLARINAQAAGVALETFATDTLAPLPGAIDVALANPPYMMDDANRAYRDGGDLHGGRTSLDMARMAAERLAPGGRLILYTGSAIVAGHDQLVEALAELANERGLTLSYRELDPDVFGEELDQPLYHDVERIALVAAVLTRD